MTSKIIEFRQQNSFDRINVKIKFDSQFNGISFKLITEILSSDNTHRLSRFLTPRGKHGPAFYQYACLPTCLSACCAIASRRSKVSGKLV